MFPTRRRLASLALGLGAAAAMGPARLLAADDNAPPNVFFSPPGRPYRAPPGAPYPVADWFRQADRDGDGKLSRAEFLADAEAFFTFLDGDADGMLNAREISFYEHSIAPEILGAKVMVMAKGEVRVSWPAGGRLWRVQLNPVDPYNPNDPYQDRMQRGPFDKPSMEQRTLPGAADILPPDVHPNDPGRQVQQDEQTAGAAPYGFFRFPEPVTATDPDYLFNGKVRKARFMDRAEKNFAALDEDGAGYLTLAALPKSPMQVLVERRRGRR